MHIFKTPPVKCMSKKHLSRNSVIILALKSNELELGFFLLNYTCNYLYIHNNRNSPLETRIIIYTRTHTEQFHSAMVLHSILQFIACHLTPFLIDLFISPCNWLSSKNSPSYIHWATRMPCNHKSSRISIPPPSLYDPWFIGELLAQQKIHSHLNS